MGEEETMTSQEIIDLIYAYGKLQYEMAAWWVIDYPTYKKKEKERDEVFNKITIELAYLENELKEKP